MTNGLRRWQLVPLLAVLVLVSLALFLAGESVRGGASGVTIRAGSGSVEENGFVTVDVDALNVTPGLPDGPLGAVTVEVKYDTELLNGSDCTPNPDGILDFGNCSPTFAAGVARCTGISASGVSGPELTLCNITFQAKKGMPPATNTALVVNCAVLTDPSGNALPCNTQDGKIVIGPTPTATDTPTPTATDTATPTSTPTPTEPVTGVKVRAGSGSVAPGGQVTIPVDALLPADATQGSFTVEVKYDPAVLDATACVPNPDGAFDFGSCSPEFAPGIARCTGISASGVSGPAEVGLCDITFQAAPDAPDGTSTPLVVNCVVKTDPDGVPLPCNTQDGKITIGQPVVVNVGDGFGVPGGNVTVPVEVLGVPPGSLGAATIDAVYDPAILDAKACDPDPDGVFDFADCNPDYEDDGQGLDTARCTAISAAGVSGDLVVVCTVTFNLSETCILGSTTTVTPEVITLTDPFGNDILFTTDPGKILCGKQGDVDCDGDSDAVDALFILQYVLGMKEGGDECPPIPVPPEGPIFLPGGDVDKDGDPDPDVDAVDALFILQCVLGLPPGADMPFCMDD